MKAGVPSSRYKSVGDLLADPEMIERGSFSEISDGSGSFRVPRQPFKLSEAPILPKEHVSDLGEDADAILRDVLDMPEDRIAQLRAHKVLL